MEMDIGTYRGSRGLVASGGDGGSGSVVPVGGVDRGDGVIIAQDLPDLYEEDFYLDEDAEYYGTRATRGETHVPSFSHEVQHHNVDLVRDSYFVGFFGPKRAGKTLAMTFFAVKAMGLLDMPCWSNYPVAFRWHDRHGKVTERRSMDLELLGLVTQRETFNHGLVLIDELPLFLNSKLSMSVKNRILGLTLSQMGKRRLSFFVSAQNEKWVDGVVRWQLDLGVYCQDASKLYQDSKLGRGETVLISILDLSGQWTGRQYEFYPRVHRYKLSHMSKLWTVYRSYEEVDMVEAIRPVAIDLIPEKITDKKQKVDVDLSVRLVKVIEALRASGNTRVNADVLWEAVGRDDPATRQLFGSVLKKWGVARKQNSDGGHAYDISNFVGPGT